jgi:hypothetical protein
MENLKFNFIKSKNFIRSLTLIFSLVLIQSIVLTSNVLSTLAVEQNTTEGTTKVEEQIPITDTTKVVQSELKKDIILETEVIQEEKGVKVTFEKNTQITIDETKKGELTENRKKEISDKSKTLEDAKDNKDTLITVEKSVKEFTPENGAINFDIGFADEHLVFSKPVKVELETKLENGTNVEVKSKHFGQEEFTTESIVNDTAEPQSSFEIKDNKITFWTIGASTFSVTPSTGTATITYPSNGSTVNASTTFVGTGGVNGATISLTIPPSTTPIGTGTIQNGQWSITPTSSLPIGSNTVCADVACNTFTVASTNAFLGLSCGKVYGTTFVSPYVTTTAKTQIVQYDPVTDTKTTLPFTIPVLYGKTRAVAMSPNGTVITYYDDADTRFESYNTVTGATVNGPVTSMAGIPNTAFNRLGYNSIGEIYSLVTIAPAPSSTYLIKIDPVTLAATNQGILLDKAGNPVSVSALGGGDLIFDNTDKGYLIDNSGYFFKINLSTRIATYLSTAPATTPAGLAYGPNGLIYTFTSAAPNGNIYAIDLAANTTTLLETQTGTVFADAFGCAFPDIAPKPSTGKTPAIVTGAAANGTGGTVSTTPATILSPGDLVEYSIVLRNGGITAATNSKYQDTLPSGTTYIANSTKMNTVTVADVASAFPYTTAKLVNSPGAATGVVSADLTPAITTDKEVTITYRVRISDPFTATPRQVSNQGTFTSDDFATIRTDDPSTTTPGDATITPINTPPVAVVAIDDNYTTTPGTAVTLTPLTGDTAGSTIKSINGTVLTPGTAQTITVPSGVVNVSSTGEITFTPAQGYVGTVTFPYEIQNTSGQTATANQIITITNTAPTATNDTYSTSVGNVVTLNPLNGDSDPDGNTLKITSINGSALTPGTAQTITVPNGVVNVSSTGGINFVPATGYTGTVTFPYVISDNNGGTATANETINIYSASPDTKTTLINTPITYNPLTNDTVPAGSIITAINGIVVIIGTPITVPGGTVTINANGTVTVSPTPGSTTPIVFTYSATTPSGTVVNAVDTINIENPKIEVDKAGKYNDTNLPTNGAGDIGETITYIFTVKNTGNVALTNITLSDPALAALGETINGGPILSLAVGASNNTTFTATHVVTLTDIQLGYFDNQATVSGTPPNGPVVTSASNDPTSPANNDTTRTFIPPAAYPDIKSTPVNTAVTYNPLANDIIPNGSTITNINGVTPIVGTPITVPNGTVVLNADNSFTFTPTNGFVGQSNFPYTVTTIAGQYVANETINIFKAVDDNKTTPVNTHITYNPITNDVVPAGSTISKINGVTPVVGTPVTVPGGTVTINANGTITVNPTPGSTTPITFPYEVTTPDGTKVTANDTITPVKAVDDNKTTPVNTPITYNPITNDVVPAGSTITAINGNPVIIGTPITVTGGTVTLNADGTVTVNPTPGSTTPIVFVYQVTTPDGTNITATDTITPVKAVDDIKTLVAGTSLTYNPLTNDSVPTSSIISKINGVTPAVGTPITVPGGTITLNTDGTITVNPDAGYTGLISFPYEVTTPDGTKVTATDTIEVIKANNDTKTTPAGVAVNLDPLDNDSVPTGSTISLINGVVPVVGTPIPVTGGTVTLNSDGTITVSPTPGSTTTITFPYEVITPDGTKTTATVTINVTNQPPVAVNNSYETLFETPVVINPLVGDTDPDGNTLTITSINGITLTPGTQQTIPVLNGVVTVSIIGIITLTPNPGYVETDPAGGLFFPYTISDGNGGVANAMVNILVNRVVDDNKTTPVDTAVTYNPLINDTLPGGSIISQINGVSPVVGTPIIVTGGTVTLNADGTITVTPTQGSTTPIIFPYEVTTPAGNKLTATDTITPVKAIDDNKTTPVSTPVTYNPIANDSVPVNSTISKINGITPIVGTPITVPGGTVTLNTNGTVTVSPTQGSTTPIIFPYEVTTPDGTKVTATDTITPVKAIDDTKTTVLGNPITYNPISNDSVPTGSTISKINGVSPVVGTPIIVTGGTVTLNADGTITVTPTIGFVGDITFPYEVTTPDGTKVTATDTITQTTPGNSVKIDKKVFKNNNSGASCNIAENEVVIVDKTRAPKAITWCFEITNTGSTYLSNILINDPTLSINQSNMTLLSGDVILAPGQTQVWYYEMTTIDTITNDAIVTATPSNSLGISLGLTDITDNDEGGARLIYVYDPPYGLKTGTYQGNNIVRWTMVWINTAEVTANNALISDEIPVGTTFNNGLVCDGRGTTVVSSCVFEQPSSQFPRGRVLINANIGPDAGGTDEADSENELVISFDNLVARDTTNVENQAKLAWEGFDVATQEPANGGATMVKIPKGLSALIRTGGASTTTYLILFMIVAGMSMGVISIRINKNN